MTRLYLITHAHTQIAPAVDAVHWQLSLTGQAQAAALTEMTFWGNVEHVLVSSQIKTHLTVAPLLARRPIPVTVDNRFDEVQRPGWVENYAAHVQAFFAAPHRAVCGWEPAAHALQRFLDGLHAHLQPNAPTTALVGHGLVLSLYRAYLLGLPTADFAAWRQLGFAAVAEVELDGPTLMTDFNTAIASPPRAT